MVDGSKQVGDLYKSFVFEIKVEQKHWKTWVHFYKIFI